MVFVPYIRELSITNDDRRAVMQMNMFCIACFLVKKF